jgi:uncharacterized protein (DUF952 family)
MIYKLLLAPEWSAAKNQPEFKGSSNDLSDGFIHCSSARQVPLIAANYYSHIPNLVLLEIDPARLPQPPRWEKASNGELYPHLYSALPLTAVSRVWELVCEADGHVFPDELFRTDKP